MKPSRELSVEEIKYPYKPSDFSFINTAQVQPLDKIIGVESAVYDLKKVLQIKSKGFNIYVSGIDNESKENIVMNIIKEIASKESTPKVIGYIYNFDKPECPIILELDAKIAKQFEVDLEEFRAFITIDIVDKLNSEEIDKRKFNIQMGLENYKQTKIMKLEKVSNSYSLELIIEENQVKFAPKNFSGNTMSMEEYGELSKEEQDEIQDKLDILYEIAEECIKDIFEYEDKAISIIKDINCEVVLEEIQKAMVYLNDKYKDNIKILKYFEGIVEELVDNIEIFNEIQGESEVSSYQREKLVNIITQKYIYHILSKIDGKIGAPVVNDEEFLYSSMGGKLVLNSEASGRGNFFKCIAPGLLHYAKGGYLIIHMDNILRNPRIWDILKNTMRTGEIKIDNLEEIVPILGTVVNPENCKMDTKIILIGNEDTYRKIFLVDEDFRKLFKQHIHLEENIDRNIEGIQSLAQMVSYECEKEDIKQVTIEGLLEIIKKYQKNNQCLNKLSNNIDYIIDILKIAQLFSSDIIGIKDIEKAMDIKTSYNRHVKSQIDENYKDGTYLLDIKGKKIGQINGLVVYQICNGSIGKPIKITATTYKGERGIIDIERASNLSGEIHTKGVHILEGFLGNEFAKEHPLSISCNICFEQSYGMVEGDSASTAELYAIISSLAGVAICQNIAVTGSMNQYGDIQPIGGVNEKIEGFFEICNQKGIYGNEGVIVPSTNVKDIMLGEDIIKAVDEGKFHIYPITHVWEGIELLTGKKKEEIRELVKYKVSKDLLFNK